MYLVPGMICFEAYGELISLPLLVEHGNPGIEEHARRGWFMAFLCSAK